MNALLGKVKLSPNSGTLNTAGKMNLIRNYIGFVPQDDIMITSLTVKDVLLHSAMTRLPPSWTLREREDLVDRVIKILQLGNLPS